MARHARRRVVEHRGDAPRLTRRRPDHIERGHCEHAIHHRGAFAPQPNSGRRGRRGGASGERVPKANSPESVAIVGRCGPARCADMHARD